MIFRKLIIAAVLGLGLAAQAVAQETPVQVMKTSTCGCCVAWMEHLNKNGFVTHGHDMLHEALIRYKTDKGVPEEISSCHTANVDGYIVEGHVPAVDIRRLLKERPDAIGIGVPGMPLGSPGMDFGGRNQAFDVFLIKSDGTTEVFSSHPAK
ncbi:MAG: DUF411 domain-containing protein [Robiginitomaculum sp.]|nr:DUF411 domain-containing protein [Robiginitomaculum sp.]